MNGSELPLDDKVSGPELQLYTPPAPRRADGPADAGKRTLWLLDQLGLPQPAGVCPRARRLQLQSRLEDRKRAALALSCRCWGCRPCASRLRRAAGLHYAEKILACYGPLFVSRSRPGRWAADLKALSRARASWVPVQDADGGSVLIGTTPLADADAVSATDAVKVLGRELRAVRRPRLDRGKLFRPLSSSASWQPPQRDPSVWRSRGRLRPRDADAVVAILQRHGIDGKVRPIAGTEDFWSVFFQLPAGWTPDQDEELEEELSAQVCLKEEKEIQTCADKPGARTVTVITTEAVAAWIEGCTDAVLLGRLLAALEKRLAQLAGGGGLPSARPPVTASVGGNDGSDRRTAEPTGRPPRSVP